MTAYEIALAAANAASAVFAKVRDDYRAMKIGDAEFLAAKAVFDAATAEFDAAYEIASALADDEAGAADAGDDAQLALF